MERQEESWTGLGVGTDRASFIADISERVPELDPAEAAEAVVCMLAERLSGGTVERLFEQLPPDVRTLFDACPRRDPGRAGKGDRDDFYLGVAEHLQVPGEEVRRILHAVFAALHGQITERESDRIASELPDTVAQTWMGARHGVRAPH